MSVVTHMQLSVCPYGMRTRGHGMSSSSSSQGPGSMSSWCELSPSTPSVLSLMSFSGTHPGPCHPQTRALCDPSADPLPFGHSSSASVALGPVLPAGCGHFLGVATFQSPGPSGGWTSCSLSQQDFLNAAHFLNACRVLGHASSHTPAVSFRNKAFPTCCPPNTHRVLPILGEGASRVTPSNLGCSGMERPFVLPPVC